MSLFMKRALHAGRIEARVAGPFMGLRRFLIDLLEAPEHGQPVIDIGRECFGLDDGSVICWRGVNYTPQRVSLRVHLHNWLVSK